MDYAPPSGVSVVWRVGPEDPNRMAAQALIDGWSWQPLTEVQERRLKARTLTTGFSTAELVLLRAAFRVVLDDRNATREFLVAVRQQVVALGGTLPAAPAARTWQQFLTAVENSIDTGAGD